MILTVSGCNNRVLEMEDWRSEMWTSAT